MDTLCIGIVLLDMATLAPLRARGTFLAYPGNLMGTVAVDTDRRAQFALAQHGIVNTLKRFRVFIEMAAPAAFRRCKGEVS